MSTSSVRQVSMYSFSHNSAYNRRFTMAVSILPTSEMIDSVCPDCGARRRYPTGAFDVVVEGGSQYPDVLGCGAFPFLIVSAAVVDDWTGSGVKCFHTYPVGVAEVRSKKLVDAPAPEYFRVEIDGRCRVDLKASGLRVIRHCPKCHYLSTEPPVASGFRMVPDSWDSSAVFRDVELYPCINYCTDLILELAGKHGRTNYRFEPMEGPFDSSSRGIEY